MGFFGSWNQVNHRTIYLTGRIDSKVSGRAPPWRENDALGLAEPTTRGENNDFLENGIMVFLLK